MRDPRESGCGGLGGPGPAYLSRVSTLGCREPEGGAPATRGGLHPAAGPGPGPPAPSLPAAAAACRSMARRDRCHRGEAAIRIREASGMFCRAPEALTAACRLRRSPPLAVTWRLRVTHKSARARGWGWGVPRGRGAGG